MFEYETWKGFQEDNHQEGPEPDEEDALDKEQSSDYGARPANSVESYFKEMARGRVLSREEESDLARRMDQVKQKIATWIRRYPDLSRRHFTRWKMPQTGRRKLL